MISLIPAAPSFDHPLEMLRACHGKILQQCDTLKKLEAHLAQRGCDAQSRQAATGILRYFDTAGQFHHMDEEENLFPALRNCPGVEHALLEQLLAEHTGMLCAWNALRPALLRIAGGIDATLDSAVSDRFIGSYTSHIEIENSRLLPMAQRLLSDRQLDYIGRKMAERRGASFPKQP